MIYTIGHKDSYLVAEMEGTVTKVGKLPDGSYPGGVAFKSYIDAARYIRDHPRTCDGFTVFGLEADWEEETEPGDEVYNHLLVDSRVIFLEEEVEQGEHPHELVRIGEDVWAYWLGGEYMLWCVERLEDGTYHWELFIHTPEGVESAGMEDSYEDAEAAVKKAFDSSVYGGSPHDAARVEKP